jgi:hypothetical protein
VVVAVGNRKFRPRRLKRRSERGSRCNACAEPDMKPHLEEYLEWRQVQVRRGKIPAGSDEPLFLHYKGRPYVENQGAWGSQNKTAFNNAKRRAGAALEKEYDTLITAMRAAGDQREVDRLLRLKEDDLKLLKSITQHWLRHKFATEAGREDLKAAMKQGGWRDSRSIAGYLIPDAEYQRKIIEDRGVPLGSAQDGADRLVTGPSGVGSPSEAVQVSVSGRQTDRIDWHKSVTRPRSKISQVSPRQGKILK